jgi:hypothetical protein
MSVANDRSSVSLGARTPERVVGEGCDRRELYETERKKRATKKAAPCIRSHE